jgi:glucosamine-6-phosphate deaminase
MTMNIEIHSDYNTLSDAVAAHVIEAVKEHPYSMICIASGDTPKGLCARLVEASRSGEVNFSLCTFVGLDEWLGMDEHDEGSCKSLIYECLFNQLDLESWQVVYFDAKAPQILEECERVNNIIDAKNGIDVMVVGMGFNGHIALNEPGTSFDTYAHVTELDPMTIAVGQKYFKKTTPLSHGVTLGLRHFREAKMPILMVSGAAKADMLHKVLTEPVTEQVPASIIQYLDQGLVMVDEAAMLKR